MRNSCIRTAAERGEKGELGRRHEERQTRRSEGLLLDRIILHDLLEHRGSICAALEVQEGKDEQDQRGKQKTATPRTLHLGEVQYCGMRGRELCCSHSKEEHPGNRRTHHSLSIRDRHNAVTCVVGMYSAPRRPPHGVERIS
jgi:hypothetical protein